MIGDKSWREQGCVPCSRQGSIGFMLALSQSSQQCKHGYLTGREAAKVTRRLPNETSLARWYRSGNRKSYISLTPSQDPDFASSLIAIASDNVTCPRWALASRNPSTQNVRTSKYIGQPCEFKTALISHSGIDPIIHICDYHVAMACSPVRKGIACAVPSFKTRVWTLFFIHIDKI